MVSQQQQPKRALDILYLIPDGPRIGIYLDCAESALRDRVALLGSNKWWIAFRYVSI